MGYVAVSQEVEGTDEPHAGNILKLENELNMYGQSFFNSVANPDTLKKTSACGGGLMILPFFSHIFFSSNVLTVYSPKLRIEAIYVCTETLSLLFNLSPISSTRHPDLQILFDPFTQT